MIMMLKPFLNSYVITFANLCYAIIIALLLGVLVGVVVMKYGI